VNIENSEKLAAVSAAELLLGINKNSYESKLMFNDPTRDALLRKGYTLKVLSGISIDQMIQRGDNFIIPLYLRKFYPSIFSDCTPFLEVAFNDTEINTQDRNEFTLGDSKVGLLPVQNCAQFLKEHFLLTGKNLTLTANGANIRWMTSTNFVKDCVLTIKMTRFGNLELKDMPCFMLDNFAVTPRILVPHTST
jgi:hypothetical protein